MHSEANATGAKNLMASSVPHSLRKNFSWTFLGNAFYAGSQWVLLVFLARLGSQAEVGQFALATAVCTPIIMFSNLKLRSVQAADALEDYPFGTYLALRFVTSVLALLAIFAILLFTGYSGTLAWVIMVMALAKTFESISDVFYGLQQRHEQMDVIAWSMMIKGVLSIVAFAVGFWAMRSLLGGVAGLAAAWAFTLICFDIPRARRLAGTSMSRPLWSFGLMRQLAVLALPLGLTVAVGSLSANVPRYFIDGLLTTEELGVFAAISYLMVAGSMIIAAIGQSATPRLAQLYRNGHHQAHYRLVMKLLAIGGAIGLAGVVVVAVVGTYILEFAYGSTYAEYKDLFFWIMVNAGIGYSYVFLGTALTSMKKFNIQLPVHLFGLAVLAGACWILMPDFGLLGAGWAMLIANVVQAGAYAAVFFHQLHIRESMREEYVQA